MKKFACQYAIVRFLPYRETGEFANVGVVMLCPEAGIFQFKLTTHVKRISAFFDELEISIYRHTAKTFKKELQRIQKWLDIKQGQRMDVELAKHLFTELTRVREAMMHFDEVRVVLADDPVHQFDELFGHYVERNFATKTYQEKLLEKDLKHALATAQLTAKYHPAVLGGASAYHVRLPFVHMKGERAVKAIKPLHLAHNDPAQIFDHGWAWYGKLNKLRSLGALPEQVLLPVQMPEATQGERFAMSREITEKMTGIGIKIVATQETQKIIEFASI